MSPTSAHGTPAQRLEEALHSKGYLCLAAHKGANNTQVTCWYIYCHPKTGKVYILQTFDHGGCELFQQVCETNSLADTIAAIV